MRKFIYIIAATLVLASCEDVIDVELKTQDLDTYVVQANLNTIDQPRAYIGKVVPVTSDTLYNGINNAIVTITDNAVPANTVTLVEDENYGGFYGVPTGVEYTGVVGRTYTINIETIEGTNITASEEILPVEPIDSIEVKPSARGAELFLGIFTYGKETPGLGNFYKWDIYINDTVLKDSDNLIFVNDELVDGNYVDGLEIFTDFNDDPTDSTLRKLSYLDTVYVKQLSITESAYDYYTFMMNQFMTGSMFSVPPANIPSNFISSDGKDVYGMFNVNDVSISNSVVIDSTIIGSLRKL